MRNDILNNINELIASRSGLLLATLNQQTIPELSATPFIKRENCFYIFISELAAHTQNLLRQPSASVMFIANEKDSRNLFARERLIFKCIAEERLPSDEGYAAVLDQLAQTFGSVVGVLRGLSDFHLFCLRPIEGQYVVGFGKAYRVEPESGVLAHISEAVLKR